VTPKGRDIALITVFVTAITLPAAGLLLQFDAGFTLQENRTLATRPELKLERTPLAEFPAKFETYFNDQFGFRRRLIHWLNVGRVFGLGVSSSPKVVLGREGWLFYGDIETEVYRAIVPFTDQQLKDWQAMFENRRDWLARRGIPYVVVVAPNKSTIYREFMPAALNRVNPQSRLDQLMDHLGKHSNLTVIDLRSALSEAKAQRQVYYRTDTHWNYQGAYSGYERIMNEIARSLPRVKAMPRTEFQEVAVLEPGKDLAGMLGLQNAYHENFVELVRRTPWQARQVEGGIPGEGPRVWGIKPRHAFEHPDAGLPRAVMFRDSFASWLVPFFAEHFSRIVFSWEYSFDRELVEREHPDIVLQEMVERTLMNEPAFLEK